MKNNKAVTLIALIITIIILLILTGVVISMTVGDNGLIKKAQMAVDEYEKAGAREKLEAVLVELQADKITKSEEYDENEYIDNKLKENKMSVNGDLVTVDGWQFLIDRSVPKIEEFEKNDSSENINVEKVVEYGEDIPLYKYLKRPSSTKFMYNGTEVKSTKDLPVGDWTVTYNKKTNTALIYSIESEYIEDLSGLKHNLYLKNGTTIKKDEQGKNYLSFDGKNDYAQINKLEETIDWTNGFTIEFEATWEALNDWSRILDFGNGASNNNIVITNDSTTDELEFIFFNGSSRGTKDESTISTIVLNEKAKYTIKYEKNEDNNKIIYYKNGEEIFTTTTKYTINNISRTSNYIGRSNWSENGYYKGKIYSLKITQADGTNVLWYDINKWIEMSK